jgi:predicted Zn-dependent protease
MSRKSFRSPGRAGLLACALGAGLWSAPLAAQEPGPLTPTKDAPAHFDPSDVFLQGWLLSRDGEKLQAEKNYLEALEKFTRARQLFDSVATYFPLWKPEMVKGRRAMTEDFIAAVGPEALKQNEQKARAIAELEGGVIAGVTDGEATGPLPLAPLPGIQKVETLETRRIAELESRVKALQQDLANSGQPGAADRNASRVRDLATQRDMAQAELKRANDELAKLRSRFAAQPMQEEMRKLAGQLQAVEREKAAMSQALGQSQQETRQAKEQIHALQAERTRLAQQAADLEKNLEVERKAQNEVIAGQEKQLRQLREQLRGKNDELAKANLKIAALESQLAEVLSEVDGLKAERETLLREKEQMAALLNLSEGSRIQEVIDQNLGLAKQLREAEEKVKRLTEFNHASLDDLNEATRDLAIAKGNINDFKRERAAQEQRIADLERRLRAESAGLAASGAAPEEAEELRKLIQKQLRIQERRRQASEILVDAVSEKAKTDETIREALALFKQTELPLSPRELELVKDRDVDDEFVFAGAQPRDQVDANVAALERDNLPYTDAATRAYLNGRFQSCRELFELVLERHPGDADTMCRLGNVHLQLRDPVAAADIFRRATELSSNNPYAHRMLGRSLMEIGAHGEALEALKKSVALAPTNAYGRVILGKLCFDLGQEEEAEEQLKSAIVYDDAMWQPHYNLAYLYAKQGKKKQGLTYYRNAIERGANFDPKLDQQLGN